MTGVQTCALPILGRPHCISVPPGRGNCRRALKPLQSWACTMALGPHARQGHPRAEADRGCRNPGRHIRCVLRDQEPTGYPAGRLCSPRLRRAAYPATFPLHPSPRRSRVKPGLLQRPASAQVLWKTVPRPHLPELSVFAVRLSASLRAGGQDTWMSR